MPTLKASYYNSKMRFHSKPITKSEAKIDP